MRSVESSTGELRKPANTALHTREQRREFTIRREILWESESALDSEVNQKELELIRVHRSNDPAIGYNRWPVFKV